MSGVADRFATWDAAYVLGALSPAERREYEEHLAGCPACQAAVSELAGLPGLLAQVPPEEAAALVAPDPVETLQEGPPVDLLASWRGRARRRRMVAALAGAAAALVLVLAGIAYAVGLVPFGARDPQHLAFSAVVANAFTANVDVVPTGDGTDIRVQCSYGEEGEGAYEQYSIYVVDRAGRAELVKVWPAKPNKVMRPSGHTQLPVRRIGTVEIRDTASNVTLLRAALH